MAFRAGLAGSRRNRTAGRSAGCDRHETRRPIDFGKAIRNPATHGRTFVWLVQDLLNVHRVTNDTVSAITPLKTPVLSVKSQFPQSLWFCIRSAPRLPPAEAPTCRRSQF